MVSQLNFSIFFGIDIKLILYKAINYGLENKILLSEQKGADDTIIFVKDLKSAEKMFEALEKFKIFSALSISKDKTNCIYI